jgi:hypothetical protein
MNATPSAMIRKSAGRINFQRIFTVAAYMKSKARNISAIPAITSAFILAIVEVFTSYTS